MGDVILRDKNGSAVDAAITVTLCIGMLNAFSSGIGGGGFMVIRSPDNYTGKGKREGGGHIVAIDFRETAPAAANQSMYAATGRNGSQVGGLAVGVPGELRGFEAAHKLYGKLPWADVVQPVADLGINGFQVSAELAKRLQKAASSFMADDPVWKEVYYPNGVLAVEGDTIYRKNYGATLAAIAQNGTDAFYKGTIADDIVSAVQARGGILTQADLQGYKIKKYPAISSSFRGKKVYTVDAPSSGLVMLGLLNIYEALFPKDIKQCWEELDIFNRLESIKFAFGARSDVSDPAFGQNRTRLNEIKTKAWAKKQRKKITDKTHEPEYYGLDDVTPPDHGTTHIAVLDDSGGAASITSTVNLQWGSHIMAPKSGVILNNEMDDFAIPGAPDAFGLAPQALNFVAAGKRPLSSTAPTIIEDKKGKVYAVLGGSGGSRIFPGVAQVILNMECGQDIGEAIERPRWHNQLSPNITSLEVGPKPWDAPLDVIAGLESRGYIINLFDVNANVGQVNGIQVKGGRIWASSDSRKNGVAAGYTGQ